MSSEPQSSSTPIGVSRAEELFVNADDNLNEEDECNAEASEPPLDTTTKEAEVENPFQVFKKPRRLKVWDDFLEPELVNKQWKVSHGALEFAQANYMSSEPQSSSTPIGVSRVEELFVNADDNLNEEDEYMSSEPQSSSTPIGVSRVEELFVNADDNLNEEDECNAEASEPPLDTTTKEAEVENPFQVFKKPRRSKVWDDFLEPELVNKQWKVSHGALEFAQANYMSSEPQSSSTPISVSRVEELFVNADDNLNEEDECNAEASEPPLDTTTKEAEVLSMELWFMKMLSV
ncbi:hypothetical protein V6N13_050983 [Hibiscus sabdariffa]